MRGFGPGMEPKKIQRYLELMSNERVAACFGLSPAGTKKKVRGKESSTLKSIYDLWYGKTMWLYLFYFFLLGRGNLCVFVMPHPQHRDGLLRLPPALGSNYTPL